MPRPRRVRSREVDAFLAKLERIAAGESLPIRGVLVARVVDPLARRRANELGVLIASLRELPRAAAAA